MAIYPLNKSMRFQKELREHNRHKKQFIENNNTLNCRSVNYKAEFNFRVLSAMVMGYHFCKTLDFLGHICYLTVMIKARKINARVSLEKLVPSSLKIKIIICNITRSSFLAENVIHLHCLSSEM
ncbi:hypothetical protein PHYBLDRAFT_170156 [Phycomyces blakesleeanus NRRL 1555(-)]|uniref:Uncharacterized protein n=1 Tax=Phycomyces blakesleeanus (strain ATCC 8743b / DSM 1359 / FGSC 10004 / NBRC 33097 / NRRL 1555) TaxID=763407 RepID=A0A162WY24_PHYB8|nr:hypothetical protein PHYBLDRAFT_170156 [Phycomyces blakesleeanus NRRL 1555(-)]OAD71485.1 hypothetical protein PHYBLDRAFT_170156 [Phycomyces blakesleeanus NRRL 1555(-)]|eukprot:XP_018289525.1 hypothetical protein PHYBLDRAFT_170156 [Phycomyces blakesleeanus NRRL 1555(-)]